MILLIFLQTIDIMFPFSMFQLGSQMCQLGSQILILSRPGYQTLFLSWTNNGSLNRLILILPQLKLLLLLIDPLQWMFVHHPLVFLGGILIQLRSLDLILVISPHADILAVRSNKIVFLLWLMFLILVILSLIRIHKDNLNGSNICKLRCIIF
jgi:hypothetical protein